MDLFTDLETKYAGGELIDWVALKKNIINLFSEMQTDQNKDFAQMKKLGSPDDVANRLTLLEEYKKHGTPEQITKAFNQIKVVLDVIKETGLTAALKELNQKIYGGKMSLLFTGTLAGVTFEPAKTNLQKAADYFKSMLEDPKWTPKCTLKHEPTNKFDKNAIRVFIGDDSNSFEVGWIPKFRNEEIIKAGMDKVKAEMIDFSTFDDQVVGVEISVKKIQ